MSRAAKRAFDIVLALAALVVLSPLLVLLAIAVAVESPGPPFFAQKRVGRNGKIFKCWKYRSMHRDAEIILRNDRELWSRYVANDFKLENDEDPRVTTMGRFLRRASLDELPQLVNVVLGQMGIVGPRPVIEEELRCYGPWLDDYLAVRPGLTGLWQITGDETLRYPDRAALDAHYVQTWSFWQDVKISLRTPLVVARKFRRR